MPDPIITPSLVITLTSSLSPPAPVTLQSLAAKLDANTQLINFLIQQQGAIMTALRNPAQADQTDAQIITGAATTAGTPLPVPPSGKNDEDYVRTLSANLTDYSYATSAPGRIVRQTFTNSAASGAFIWTINAQTGDTWNAPDLTAATSFSLAAGESRSFKNTATGTWNED